MRQPMTTQSETSSWNGKVALVTGANSGIGLVTARELAKMGLQVFLACRSAENARAAIAEIGAAVSGAKLYFLALDLGDFASVRRAADDFLRRNLPLHVLVDNAGIAGGRGLTASGFEAHFGINHMGHFLLTRLLLSRLQESAPSRVVVVASDAHYQAKGIELGAMRRPTRSVTGVLEYRVSKLANVLFAAELARRVDKNRITTYSLHPGVVASQIWRRIPWPARSVMKLFMLSNEEGAKTTLYCATSPAVAKETGLYYEQCRVKTPSSYARDETLARTLWEWSEEQVAGSRG
jgi:NAD(P)-dependent dehydrogenase (short-subunit alcohol dehydrogenase family)